MISHFFIDRPIFATVLSLVIVIAGGVSLITLPIAQYPEMTPPTVQVSAIYPGANARVVAETVATPIEQEVNGVEGMIYMSSRCTNDGQMLLDVTFEVGTNLDIAQVLVQNRVKVAESKLPEEVTRQGVTTKKKSPSILLCVNLISPDNSFDILRLSNYATLNIKDSLARIRGVGDVSIIGSRDFSMRIWLDPRRMSGLNITTNDVLQALREQNVQVAAGRIGQPPASGVDFQETVIVQGRLLDAEQFDEVVIKTSGDGRITRLKDIARSELGAKSYDASSYLDGQPSVTLAIFQLPGSNALDTAAALRRQMEQLRASFPPGIDYKIVYDTTVFVNESIRDVVKTLFEAVGLVFLVVLVFLQTWRATIIPMIAVPVSLIGTFLFMSVLGFSLNNLSLFGLVLAIGVVVDDAIVVVENVETHLKKGLSARDAARLSMTQVTGPIIATSLVLVAVFVPTAFMAGISGEFYKQFALTIATATVISTFNSLTMSPALAALLLKPHGAKPDALERGMGFALGWFFQGFNWVFDRVMHGYGRAVTLCLRLTLVAIVVYGGLIFLTYQGFRAVPGGFIPQQDKGYLVVNAQLPEGASLERTEKTVAQINQIVLNTEGVQHTIGMPGYSVMLSTNLSNVGGMFVILAPFDERKGKPHLSAAAIGRKLMQQFAAEVRSARVVAFGAPPIDGLGSTGGFKLYVQDRANAGAVNLQTATGALIEAANRTGAYQGMFTSFTTDQPQLYVDLDRNKAKTMGVPLTEIFSALQTFLGSAYANDFTYEGRNWQVNVQADEPYRMRPDDIRQIKVRNQRGEMVPLATLLRVSEVTGPAIVTRYNLFPAADVNGAPAPGVSSGEMIGLMDRLSSQELPRSMGFEWTELTLQQIFASQDLLTKLVFPLAVVLVFLVLAAQYESWSLPLAVILIVPMCILCALAGVWLIGSDNNIFTQIGLVVLVGLAAKNAILIVEFAKEQQNQGLPRFAATVEASRQRLRPILMTAFTFILGTLPLLLATGAGAEMRVALGIAVFSGMLGVTLFGIFFTPIFFYAVTWFSEFRGGDSSPPRTGAPGEPSKQSPTPTPNGANGEPVAPSQTQV